jgi:hypothetical protein
MTTIKRILNFLDAKILAGFRTFSGMAMVNCEVKIIEGAALSLLFPR